MTAATAGKPLDLFEVHAAVDPKQKLQRCRDLIQAAEEQLAARRLRRNAAAVVLFRRANAEAVAAGLPPEKRPMQPAAMWRDTMDVSRRLWHDIVEESDPDRLATLLKEMADAQAEIDTLPAERAAELGRLTRERDKLARRVARHAAQVKAIRELEVELADHPELDLLAVAREESAASHRLEALIAEARPIRNQLAHDLMNGVYRKLYGREVSNAEVMRLSGLSSAFTTRLRALR